MKSVLTIGGTVLGSSMEVRKATFIVNLKDKSERSTTPAAFKREVSEDLRRIPDIRFWFIQDDGQRELQVAVLGRDEDAVERAASLLTVEARRLPELDNVVSTADLARPELRIRPRMLVAAELGVSTEAIADTVRIATIGDINANLARLEIASRQVPIRVMLRNGARGDRRVLQTLRVPTVAGAAVPLSTVASLEMGQGTSQIDRYDRMRRVTIGADLASDAPLGTAVEAIRALPSAQRLPAGMEIRQLGSAEVMQDVFENFGRAILAGVVMVYAVLVVLFSRTLQPLTILVSLPLSVGGATIALVATGNSLSLPVIIGILMLMGIVTKNAIMIVDFALEEIAAGKERTEALVEAGRKRARPVVMTTVAMIGGMVPSALGFGSGGEFRSPMAIAVIGGLISSTALSLLFVPAFFTIIDDIGSACARRTWGWLGNPRPRTAKAPPNNFPDRPNQFAPPFVMAVAFLIHLRPTLKIFEFRADSLRLSFQRLVYSRNRAVPGSPLTAPTQQNRVDKSFHLHGDSQHVVRQLEYEAGQGPHRNCRHRLHQGKSGRVILELPRQQGRRNQRSAGRSLKISRASMMRKADCSTTARCGGFLDDIYGFDPAFFDISPREVEDVEPQQYGLLQVVYEALQDAHVTMAEASRAVTGVFVGITMSERPTRSLLECDRTIPANDIYAGTGVALCTARPHPLQSHRPRPRTAPAPRRWWPSISPARTSATAPATWRSPRARGRARRRPPPSFLLQRQHFRPPAGSPPSTPRRTATSAARWC